MRIALIPTGVMELGGLAESLKASFGGEHEFVAVPFVPEAPGEKAKAFAGFTSNGVNPAHASMAESPVRLLVAELAQQVYPRARRGRTEPAADLAIVIDDLELENVGNEVAVVGTFRDAVERHIAEAGPATDRSELRRCLREHGSFHLISVMAEAWFFADPNGMALNGVPAGRTAQMVAGIDPEAFVTADPGYLTDHGSGCATLVAALSHPRKRPQYTKAPWVLTPDPRYPHRIREKHPKHYLEWLCRDVSHKRCTTWREVGVGSDALARLNWSAVLANPQHCGFARSFIEDVALTLGVGVPGASGARHEAHTRFLGPTATTAVLRNI
jgi:hypothetical protein